MISWWEVLKASKGLPVNDYYAQMWGKQLGAAGYVIADLTAPLPLNITTDGTALLDYRIYGATVDGESVGVETESGEPTGYKLPMVSRGGNLLMAVRRDGMYDEYGEWHDLAVQVYETTDFMPVVPGTYELYFNKSSSSQDEMVPVIGNFWDSDRSFVKNIYNDNLFADKLQVTITEPGYITFSYRLESVYFALFYSKATTPIYIGDTKLAKDEYVSYAEQKIYKFGENLADWDKGVESNVTKVMNADGSVTIRGSSAGTYRAYQFANAPNNGTDVLGLVLGKRYTISFDVIAAIIQAQSGQPLTSFCYRLPSGNIRVSDGKPLSVLGHHSFEFLYDVTGYLSVLMTNQTYDNYVTIANLQIRESISPTDPPVPLPALPTTEGSTTFEYGGGEPQPEQMYVKYRRKD